VPLGSGAFWPPERLPNTVLTGLAARGRSPKPTKNGLQLLDSTFRFGVKTTITTGC
jgi:hypothetical protein